MENELTRRLMVEVKAEMARQDMENPDLAAKIGVSPTTVWRWTAFRNKPSIDDLDRICAALGISIPDLLARAASVPSPDGPATTVRPVDLRPDRTGFRRSTGQRTGRNHKVVPARPCLPALALATAA